MYQYPYGNAQQLNLDWVLGKIQELEAGTTQVNIEEVANALVSASFDAGVSYRRYDYCFYNGKLYRALNDTSGAFNPADWIEVVIGDDIPVLTRLINAVDTSLTSLQTTVGNQGNDITNLQTALGDLDSDDVDNASLVVSGDTVTDALDNLSDAVDDVKAAIAIVADGDNHIAISSGNYVYINNHGTLPSGLYVATSNIPLNEVLTISNVSPVANGGLNQITNIEHGGTNADNSEEALRNLGLSTGVLIGASIFGTGIYASHQTGDQMYFMFGKFGSNPLAFIQLTNSGTATIVPLISNTAPAHIPTVSVEDGKTKIEMPAWETLRYFSYYPGAYFEQV